MQYEGDYGYVYFKPKTKNKRKNKVATRYELIWEDGIGYLVVCNGKRQAVFYEGHSGKYAVIMLYRATFLSKKPIKFY